MDDEEDERTILVNDVTVTKRLDTTQFDVPTVILEINRPSTADRSTSVTITEPIPDSFGIENVGFHRNESGYWSRSKDEIVFNRTIDPGEEYTTVYSLRDVTDGKARRFLDSETVVSTDAAGYSAAIPETAAQTDADDVADMTDDVTLLGSARNVLFSSFEAEPPASRSEDFRPRSEGRRE